jgi:hypothetical protein
MYAIKEATEGLSLEDARRISHAYGFTDASSKISLVVPGENHESVAFAKLSEYAEWLLMNKIYKKSWEPTRRMLVTLEKIPYARSLEGRIFEDVAHVLFSDPETELEPLYGAPPKKLGDLGPLRYVSLSDAMKKRPGDEGDQNRLVAGYYGMAAKNEATQAIDAMAIVKDSDSKGDFQRVVLFKYTHSDRDSSKPVGLSKKVRANFKKLGLEDLVPFEKSDSDDRHHYVFIRVVPKSAAANFKVPKLKKNKNKWNIDQYKLVVDMDKLDEKKPSRL